METSVRLYALNYDEAKTYLWAAFFVACNLVLPQLFHLILTSGIETTIADVTIGWPGLLLQVFGSWLILKYIR
jgi:hypothetical protein